MSASDAASPAADPVAAQRDALLGRLNDMVTGQVVRILATDPASVRDFEAFARQTGNQLVQQSEQDGAFVFLLRRK